MKADVRPFRKQHNSLFVHRVFTVRERWCRVESSPLFSHAPRLARAHWAAARDAESVSAALARHAHSKEPR